MQHFRIADTPNVWFFAFQNIDYLFGNFDTAVEAQTSTVTFTHVYVEAAPAPAPVDLQPNFTG